MTNPSRPAPTPPPVSLVPLQSSDELIPLHHRQYEAATFKLNDSSLLLRGAIRDLKPAGLYVPNDPEPLIIHHMQVDLTVNLADFVITDATVDFIAHPDVTCPLIVDHYRKLIGVSIARGFGRTIRELFGGPRGCAHTTALLQAMAPAAIQSMWSLSLVDRDGEGAQTMSFETSEDVERSIASNLNTCHVWDEAGEHVKLIRKGDIERRPPLSVIDRLEELGRDKSEWLDN